MNNNKNKLNSKIILIFLLVSKHALKKTQKQRRIRASAHVGGGRHRQLIRISRK